MSHEPHQLKGASRELRRRQTLGEAAMWATVRRRGFLGLKFKRQHEIGRFILDFYCEELKLAIEMDGAAHLDLGFAALDDARTEWLQRRGITVVRIENEEMLGNPALVLGRLTRIVAGFRAIGAAKDPHP